MQSILKNIIISSWDRIQAHAHTCLHLHINDSIDGVFSSNECQESLLGKSIRTIYAANFACEIELMNFDAHKIQREKNSSNVMVPRQIQTAQPIHS